MSEAGYAEFLSVEDIMRLHAEGMKRWSTEGGGVHSGTEDCVEGRIGSAWNASLYRDPDDSAPLLCFAGYLLYYLAKDHCFGDGNKRAAWLAACKTLQRMGLTLDCSDEDAESFVLGIIDGEEFPDGESVIEWLAERVTLIQ